MGDWGVRFTNAMIAVPPAPHLLQVFFAAQESETLRKTFVEAFNQPELAFPWIEDPEAAEALIGAAAQ